MSLYDDLLDELDDHWDKNAEFERAKANGTRDEFLGKRINESPAMAIKALCELLDERAAATRNLADQQAIMRQVTSRA